MDTVLGGYCIVKLLHSSPFQPGEEAGAAASRGRGGPAWGHTACHPRFIEGQSRAAEPRRGRGRGPREQGGTGTAGRDLQRLERWGHEDVHWPHTPPSSLRLSPFAPSHSLAPPQDQQHAPSPQQTAGATRPYC
jgi:hypothetical protein